MRNISTSQNDHCTKIPGELTAMAGAMDALCQYICVPDDLLPIFGTREWWNTLTQKLGILSSNFPTGEVRPLMLQNAPIEHSFVTAISGRSTIDALQTASIAGWTRNRSFDVFLRILETV